MSERWLPITETTGYEVSSHGRVRRDLDGRIVKLYWHAINEYLSVTLSLGNNTNKPFRVNRLVCRAFHGDPPDESYHASHKDGDSRYNHASNLRWLTNEDNQLEKHFIRFARKNLTPADCVDIARSEEKPKVLAIKYNVKPRYIREIIRHYEMIRD